MYEHNKIELVRCTSSSMYVYLVIRNSINTPAGHSQYKIALITNISIIIILYPYGQEVVASSGSTVVGPSAGDNNGVFVHHATHSAPASSEQLALSVAHRFCSSAFVVISPFSNVQYST